MTSDDQARTPWPGPGHTDRPGSADPSERGGDGYARLNQAQRLLQDRLAGATPSSDEANELADRLAELSELLTRYQGSERARYDGWRMDLPGRGHPLMPPYLVDHEDETSLRGRVTFTRFYLGGNGAAHGGAHPLLFDDILGRLMNRYQPGIARTASLKVNYRRITPIDVELAFDARLDRIDGRKRWGIGRILDSSGQVLADAEGFFLQLLPGQP